MKKKIRFIVNIVKELEYIQLSEACGKYFALSTSGKDILVTSFAGKYGYKQTPIDKLNKKVIDTLYDDLSEFRNE